MNRDFDGDSGSHLQRSVARSWDGGGGGAVASFPPSSPSAASDHLGGGDGSVDAGGETAKMPSSGGGGGFDPCHITSNTNCIAAIESSVDQMTMGCGSLPLTNFSRFRPMSDYFNNRRGGGLGGRGRGGSIDGDDDHRHRRPGSQNDDDGGPYPSYYSPSSPVGPASCEYCGAGSTEDCAGNLPGGYNKLLAGVRGVGIGGGRPPPRDDGGGVSRRQAGRHLQGAAAVLQLPPSHSFYLSVPLRLSLPLPLMHSVDY